MDRLTAYKVMGLGENATVEDVKRAYKELAQKYNLDGYEAGPLRDEAAGKMDELNQAFDLLMSYLRTGEEPMPAGISSGTGSPQTRYPAIRRLINNGSVDEALAELSAIAEGPGNAEWNFLVGSAYYYKGWLDQAYTYFAQAVRLDPSNRAYSAALQNLQKSAGGEMPGNPYAGQNTAAQAMNCACNTCSLMLCTDACCSCCRGS